jgi:hypothetical protein
MYHLGLAATTFGLSRRGSCQVGLGLVVLTTLFLSLSLFLLDLTIQGVLITGLKAR